MRLCDVGERQLLRGLVRRHCVAAGDDCAVLPVEFGSVVVTTDPVPRPAADLIAGDSDPYWIGWLLVTINASDLAASGARPLGFVAAIDAPRELEVASLDRLIEGIANSCSAAGLEYAGGNLREAPTLGAVGTAIGQCKPGAELTRSGATQGQVLASVGGNGRFWRDALAARDGRCPVAKAESPLFQPKSQIHVLWRLAEAGLISASMDNSDGLLPTLEELAMAGNVEVTLELALLRDAVPDPVPDVDPARLWLGWGDWNVVVAIDADRFDEARAVVEQNESNLTRIGSISKGPARVVLRGSNAVVEAPRLESERFAEDSWFVGGIDMYVELLLKIPLPG